MNYVSLHKCQLLDSLENKVLYADFCALVIGERGIGKTFFLDQLVKRLESQVCLSQIDAVPDLTFPQLEQSVSMQLGLAWQGSQPLVERIAERIEQRVLVCIDNAHFLSPNCLDKLMEVVKAQLDSNSVQVFFVMTGEASLAEKLNHSSVLQSNPNCCVVFELEAIAQNETKYLIAQFQSIDVGTAEALYDEQQLNYFWQLSKGIPIELQYQLNRWLSEKSVKTELTATPSVPKKMNYWPTIGYASAAIGLIVVLFYQDAINELFNEPSNLEVAQEQSLDDQSSNDLTERLSNENELVKNTQNGDIDDSAQARDSQSIPATERLTINPPDSAGTSNAALVEAETNDSTRNDQLTEKANDADVLGDFLKEKLTEEQVVSSTVSSNPVPASISKNESTALLNENSNSSAKFSADESKLLEANDEQFALQWVVVSSLESANRFRSEHPLSEQMMIFRRKKNSGFLYFVISGRYNSAIDAENAATVYARREYPGKPWKKSFKSIKKDIFGLQS